MQGAKLEIPPRKRDLLSDDAEELEKDDDALLGPLKHVKTILTKR